MPRSLPVKMVQISAWSSLMVSALSESFALTVGTATLSGGLANTSGLEGPLSTLWCPATNSSFLVHGLTKQV